MELPSEKGVVLMKDLVLIMVKGFGLMLWAVILGIFVIFTVIFLPIFLLSFFSNLTILDFRIVLVLSSVFSLIALIFEALFFVSLWAGTAQLTGIQHNIKNLFVREYLPDHLIQANFNGKRLVIKEIYR